MHQTVSNIQNKGKNDGENEMAISIRDMTLTQVITEYGNPIIDCFVFSVCICRIICSLPTQIWLQYEKRRY